MWCARKSLKKERSSSGFVPKESSSMRLKMAADPPVRISTGGRQQRSPLMWAEWWFYHLIPFTVWNSNQIPAKRKMWGFFLCVINVSSMFLQRRKFVVESRASKKKNTFITERSKIAKYLCKLCSAQHKFNNEMNSRQLTHSLVSGQLLHHDDCQCLLLGCRTCWVLSPFAVNLKIH